MPKHCIALSEWGMSGQLGEQQVRIQARRDPVWKAPAVLSQGGSCACGWRLFNGHRCRGPPRTSFWFGLCTRSRFKRCTCRSHDRRLHRNENAAHELERDSEIRDRHPAASRSPESFVCLVQPDGAKSRLAFIHQSRTLTVLRDTLLPKLISGEMRVSNTALIVEAAV